MAQTVGQGRTAPNSGVTPKLIETKLQALPRDGGVWRNGLATFLGRELCTHLHITQADSVDEVRAKAIWHLRRLVTIFDGEVRQSAEFAFNILNVSSYPELRTVKRFQHRAEWGYSRGLCPADRTARGHMSNAIVPDLTRELLKGQLAPPRGQIEAIIAEWGPGDASDRPTSGDSVEPANPGDDIPHIDSMAPPTAVEPAVVNQLVDEAVVDGGVIQIGFVGGDLRKADD